MKLNKFKEYMIAPTVALTSTPYAEMFLRSSGSNFPSYIVAISLGVIFYTAYKIINRNEKKKNNLEQLI